MTGSQQGYLLIADITGYTLYLSKSELEHAEQVLETLLKLLIEHTRPPLRISRLEGDAVISYSLAGINLQGQTFVEMIEDTYVAFRRAIDLMVMNNSCRCNACANINALDLKFFVHYGTFAIQRLGSQDELVGSDVNLIHRLLKNHVREQTGIRAYTLYTNAAIQHLNMEGFTEKLVPHQEAYEHLGSVDVWIQDMQPVWQRKRDAVQITIPADQVSGTLETEIAMPPELVWDYLLKPEFAVTVYGSDGIDFANRSHGRVDLGSVVQCYHGENITPQVVIQWQPMKQMILESLIPLPMMKVTVLVDVQLIPTEKGTRLIQVISKPRGPLPGRILAERALAKMAPHHIHLLDDFRDRIEQDLQGKELKLPAAEFPTQAIKEAAVASLPSGSDLLP